MALELHQIAPNVRKMNYDRRHREAQEALQSAHDALTKATTRVPADSVAGERAGRWLEKVQALIADMAKAETVDGDCVSPGEAS